MGLLHTKCVNRTVQLDLATIIVEYTDRDVAIAATLQRHVSYMSSCVIAVKFQLHFGGL